MTRRFRVYAQCDYQKSDSLPFFLSFFWIEFPQVFPLHSPVLFCFFARKVVGIKRRPDATLRNHRVVPPSPLSFSLDWFRRGHLRIFRRRLTRWNFRPFNRRPPPPSPPLLSLQETFLLVNFQRWVGNGWIERSRLNEFCVHNLVLIGDGGLGDLGLSGVDLLVFDETKLKLYITVCSFALDRKQSFRNNFNRRIK